MHRSLVFIALCLVVESAAVAAQSVVLTTLQNSPLFVAASSLTTNGSPGFTNSAAQWQVCNVGSASAQGGTVALVSTQEWVRRYSGPGNWDDRPFLLVLDAAGNCVVSGYSYGAGHNYDWATIKYANNGAALWTNRYDGLVRENDYTTGLAADSAGNVYVAGSSTVQGATQDAVVIKYAGDGPALWTNRFNYSGTNYHGVQELAVDPAGNVVLLIATVHADVGFLTLKYDTFGNAIWTNRYNPRADGSEFPAALALDDAGNVFVTGNSDGDGTSTDILTLKYGPDGIAHWTNRYHRTFSDYGRTITVDRMGNVFVSGEVSGALTNVNYATVKYSGNGAPLWTNILAGPNYSGGTVPLLKTDLFGNAFITGGSPGASGSQVDVTTVKVTGDGFPLWTNRFSDLNNTGNGSLGGSAVDHAGQLYFAGHAVGPGGNLDYLAVKFGEDGIPLWTNRLDGPGHGFDYGEAIAVSELGDVYVTGLSYGGFSNNDYATVKYSDYVLYMAPAGFLGTDSFTFTAVDKSGNGATGVVNVIVVPPLRFNTTNLQFTPLGLRLQVDNARGTNPVVIYASTNLVDWESIFSAPPVSGSLPFIDAAASGFPRRFYRAVQ